MAYTTIKSTGKWSYAIFPADPMSYLTKTLRKLEKEAWVLPTEFLTENYRDIAVLSNLEGKYGGLARWYWSKAMSYGNQLSSTEAELIDGIIEENKEKALLCMRATRCLQLMREELAK